MKKVFVIYCNPKSSSLTESTAKAFIEGSKEVGNEVRELNVYNINFDFLNYVDNKLDFSLTPELKEAQETIKWADQIVFAYPVWHGGAPAKLKSFIERIFHYGFAVDANPKGFPKPLLKGKTAVIIQFYGMPYFIMKFFCKDLSYQPMKYPLTMSGIKIVKRFDFDMVDAGGQARKEKWFEKIRQYAAKN